jgi:hypothetical protein
MKHDSDLSSCWHENQSNVIQLLLMKFTIEQINSENYLRNQLHPCKMPVATNIFLL